MPKEPTRAQLSSKLGYQSHTPSFLLKLQRQIGGRVQGRRDDEDYDEDEDEGQFEDDGSGRPPIPVRPTIPERPDDEPGSADEDDGDEKPQVVVLREGKHLTEREVENEKRKAKGLPPLPEASDKKFEKDDTTEPSTSGSKSTAKPSQSLSFSSGGGKSSSKKRKAVGTAGDEDEPPALSKKKTTKKPKKAEKKLLSFEDDA